MTLRQDFVRQLQQAVRQANFGLERELAQAAPDSSDSPPRGPHSKSRRKTGRTTRKLNESITVQGPNGGAGGDLKSVAFTQGAPQAGWTNDGTQPHIITAKGRVLAWSEAGQDVIVGPRRGQQKAEVNHPGNRGTDWFDKTINEQYVRLLEDAIDQHVA